MSVALFYRYFLPTPPPPSGSDAAVVDEATLGFFRLHASHYLPLLQQHQQDLCRELGDDVKGRILLSQEGINGTLSFATAEELGTYRERMEGFDLLRDLGAPPALAGDTAIPAAGAGRFFANIDWKISSSATTGDPFPDLFINVVKEIVNTGGTVPVDDIPRDTGREIDAEEFHNILTSAQNSGGAGSNGAGQKEVVLIDVRNTFEHAIGHFLHPSPDATEQDKEKESAASPTPALNPNMVTFSHFDSTFCSRKSDELRNKKVLMYCTGGIRCVKASAMLKKRGVEDVSHLKGGIHRYVEKYGTEGFWKGKVFVFDQRVALDAESMMKKSTEQSSNDTGDDGDAKATVVGSCIECNEPFDEISGAILCTVCRDLVLVCPACRASLHEFHCDRHSSWKNDYFTFLERYSSEELRAQRDALQKMHDTTYASKDHKNTRRTLRKQIEKVAARMNDLESGAAAVEQNAKRRCRTCFESEKVCDGLCWGFWKTLQSPQQTENEPKGKKLRETIEGHRVQSEEAL